MVNANGDKSKKKKTTKSKMTKKPPHWYTSFKKDAGYRKNILEGLERVGFPLELRVMRILDEQDFIANESQYQDTKEKDGKLYTVNRQIDIYAYPIKKEGLEPNIPGFSMYFPYTIVGECTSLAEQCIVFFELSDHEKKNNFIRIPIFAKGTPGLIQIHDGASSLKSFQEFFNIDQFTKKVAQFSPKKLVGGETGKNKDDSDIVYHKCNQILSALKFFLDRWRGVNGVGYSNVRESSGLDDMFNSHPLLKADGSTRQNRNNAVSNITDSFNPKNLHGHINVDSFIPLLVVNEETLLLKALCGEKDYSLKDLKEVKYFIYLFAPADLNKYGSVVGSLYHQAIIICNVKYLKECIKEISSGMGKLREKMESNIQRNPKYIVEELMADYRKY